MNRPQAILALIWAIVAVIGSIGAIALWVSSLRDLRAVRRYHPQRADLLLLARGACRKYACGGVALILFVLVGLASLLFPPGAVRMYLGRTLIVAEILLVVMLEIDWRIQRILVRPAIVSNTDET